mgnify:CR=1 FL=1
MALKFGSKYILSLCAVTALAGCTNSFGLDVRDQFGSILDAVARVQELNLEGVKATSHPQPIENIFREDQVQPSLTPEQALSGAPAQEDQRFRVPQILGEAE